MNKTYWALASAVFFAVNVTPAYAGSAATATVGDLTFELIDLAPDDGIAPSFQFTPQALPGSYASTSVQVSASDNGGSQGSSRIDPNALSPLSVSATDLVHAGAFASVTQDGVTASGFAAGPSTSFNSSASTSTGSYYYGGMQGVISLSANSILLVKATGHVSAYSAVDSSSYCSWYCDQTSASVGFGLNYNYSLDGSTTSYSFNDGLNTSASGSTSDYTVYQYDPNLGYSVPVTVSAGPDSKSLDKTMVGVFTNSSSQTQYANLSLSANVNGYGSSALPVAMVPEANGSLAGSLGLALMGWVVRRRRSV